MDVDTIFSLLWHRPNFTGLNETAHNTKCRLNRQRRNQTSLVSKGVCQNHPPGFLSVDRPSALCTFTLMSLCTKCINSAFKLSPILLLLAAFTNFSAELALSADADMTGMRSSRCSRICTFGNVDFDTQSSQSQHLSFFHSFFLFLLFFFFFCKRGWRTPSTPCGRYARVLRKRIAYA